jgi:predicted nuclease with RNAse H fold
MRNTAKFVIGIDPSGPANFDDTVLIAFECESARLRRLRTIEKASDQAIWGFVTDIPGHDSVTIGLDAPLSYNPGGGDRPGDSELRRAAIAAGLSPGSIMPPTLHRMVYLTVRGIALARGMKLADGSVPRILEVHPGAALALHGAPLADVRAFARESESRQRLLQWLESQGLLGIARPDPSSHYVAACGAAFAAWQHTSGQSRWFRTATPPEHPYDYCA